MNETTQDINNTFETFNQNCSTLQPCLLLDIMKPKDTGSSIYITKFCHKIGPHPTSCGILSQKPAPLHNVTNLCPPPLQAIRK